MLPTLKLSSFENFLLSSPCMEELSFPPICSTVQPCVLGYCCCVVQSLNRVQFFVTSWTAACQASLSMQFSRQEYWSGLPILPPGDLPDPGIEPESSALPARQADSLPVEPLGNWQIGGEKIEVVTNFIFLGSKITADSDCVQEIKRHLFLGRCSREGFELREISTFPQVLHSGEHKIFPTSLWFSLST